MTPQPSQTKNLPTASSEPLKIVTQFAADLAPLTNVNALGDHIIQTLCHATAAAQGALFLLDREHACYRRANVTGPDAATLSPATLAANHPLPRHLLATNRILAETDAPDDLQKTGPDAHAALESIHGAYAVPHFGKGRLIGFSLLGATAASSPEAQTQTQPLLAALAQIATNALDTLIQSQDLHRSLALNKRTDRMKSLETIAGGFAHEIRNPLTSIKTFIQLAPERKDDPDFIQEFSKIVLGDVYRIEHLIQKILDYSRYMEPTLADEDVNDLVTSCVHFIDVKADSRKITIKKTLAPDLPRVMLDRQQIKQVLINLLINAVDAIGTQGGRLRVQTSKLVKPTGKVWIQIDIEDTGEGIQEDNLEHIFDPFFTTKPETGEHEGTGLGLTIVHQIIQEHHGEIRVKSSVGVGTTFSVSLPVLPA